MSDLRSEASIRDFVVRATGRSMSLLELMIVVFIIAIVAVGAGPIYRGYTLDAKTTEAKLLASSLWTAVTSRALATCGQPTPVASVYRRAGLDATGTAVAARWMVVAGGSSPTIDCATGALSPEGDVFTLMGLADDVGAIRVKLIYSAESTTPSRLACSIDAGASFTDC